MKTDVSTDDRAHSGARREVLIALGLSAGAAVALGFSRFAYGLLLPPMRADLGWSYAEAGALNTANGAGYIVGTNANFLLENQEAIVATNEGRVLFVELPASVELVITFTEPGLAGDSATGRTKPATLETGHEIQVPLFINQGEKVKVDTRDSSYLGRVKS